MAVRNILTLTDWRSLEGNSMKTGNADVGISARTLQSWPLPIKSWVWYDNALVMPRPSLAAARAVSTLLT